jgi:putative hydrolase of the HAD superfamily
MKRCIFSLVSTLAAAFLVAAPQAIIFDFGGVLTKDPHRELVINFIRDTFHLTQEQFEKVNEEKRQAIKQGKSDEEFWLSYAKTKGVQLPPGWSQSFKSVQKECIGVNPNMYVLVEELRKEQIPIAMLSNVDERLGKLIREFGLYEPFDPCILSYEIGMDKPDPKVYEFLLKKLGLAANDVVFIDDRHENVESAKNVGIDAILFLSEAQLRSELNKRGILNKLE